MDEDRAASDAMNALIRRAAGRLPDPAPDAGDVVPSVQDATAGIAEAMGSPDVADVEAALQDFVAATAQARGAPDGRAVARLIDRTAIRTDARGFPIAASLDAAMRDLFARRPELFGRTGSADGGVGGVPERTAPNMNRLIREAAGRHPDPDPY